MTIEKYIFGQILKNLNNRWSEYTYITCGKIENIPFLKGVGGDSNLQLKNHLYVFMRENCD